MKEQRVGKVTPCCDVRMKVLDVTTLYDDYGGATVVLVTYCKVCGSVYREEGERI